VVAVLTDADIEQQLGGAQADFINGLADYRSVEFACDSCNRVRRKKETHVMVGRQDKYYRPAAQQVNRLMEKERLEFPSELPRLF